ncbi:alpha-tocopherol transfer protein-like isoform X1 [Hylaeus anthracinus]|uniref:alpha-tocopherol transfer protein-like isoform X1 n=2 Tax=Hylaeus anthracinus TaxID=313031 RepID=UPI0023B97506|nr:alpha-tocopherol transfer protein-like isoform X1 [Hylaeus anthracinus]XP_053998780.1 alpha-tocopherol transfer protein-like isoform X1 [Hylaeus anthracinus]XP_053998781.1 alpha-tocopherol transfer protein-like isoform X1 [Hylaeus anthracinus]
MYVRQIEVLPGKQMARPVNGSSAMEREEDQDADGTITKLREVPQFKVGNFVLTVDFNDGDEEYQEKAIMELRETPEVVQQALKDIREMLKDEADLILPDDDEFFQKFMRPCKWYPKSTFELMKRFYKFRLSHPRYCENLVPSNEKKTLSSEILIPLPERTSNGCRVLLINAGKKWNPKVINIDEIFRAVILSLDAAMAEPKTQISGVHVIFNMEGFSLSHVTQFTPSFAATMTDWVQRCLPCRLKGIHIVNQPFIFNMVYAIFKPFLLEKTRKRIIFHGSDRKSLISYLGTKPLPVELGGELVVPNVPIGEGICEYFCWFEEDFESANKFGYIKKETR